MIHRIYAGFLLLLGTLTVASVFLFGGRFYLTSQTGRPFHPLYDLLKPSGFAGHGYGIIGTAMIIAGVALYSTRKRARALYGIGKIKYYLEFHIFLCTVGSILVLSHTTFKFNGLAAVAFWSMTTVVLSGITGRYIYVQIPKGIHGDELSMNELEQEKARINELLKNELGLTEEVINRIDRIAAPPKRVSEMPLHEILVFLFFGNIMKRREIAALHRDLRGMNIHRLLARRVRRAIDQRIALTRRIMFLERMKQIFHLWHVVHLPSTIVMFVFLFIHVGVAIAFRYTWIW